MSTANLTYPTLEGHYDEMIASDGSVRPHWRTLVDSMEGFSASEFGRRIQDGRRIVRDNGVTFHVQQEQSNGTDRPWPLDLIPVVLSGDEWAGVERAVVQRALLFNRILGDLYGPQKLLRDGLLPPELLYAHPGFLRPCHGIEPADGVWLTFYAADLARTPDGRWWFIGDRTEAPTGCGYALENRLVVSRTLSEAFEGSSVRRLASYFQAQRDTLAKRVPGHRDNPRVALLSPGPRTETYFEHAFLARYLGYTLVEGPDLTVRDQRIYLKTLAGLLPVDMILRQQHSELCDPVELPGDSMQGCPGLLDTVRAGNVAVANALGSGVVASPAMAAFLPTLARRLLEEDLQIPSVGTWWCGQQGPRDEVLARLDELVVKPAFPGPIRQREFGAQLSEDARGVLRERILRNPENYAAQEQIKLSTTPVVTSRGLEPRFLVVRAFAVSDGASFTVMPGGLARVSATQETLDVSVNSGGSSKDLWIVGPTRGEKVITLLPSRQRPVDVSRATFELPSRVAENLFWLGRYAERVDAAARFIRATLPLLFDESSRRSSSSLKGALGFLREMTYVEGDDPIEGSPEAAIEEGIRAAVSESSRRGSFGWQIHQLHRVGWLLRDRLSADTWKILSRLETDYVVEQSAIQEEHGMMDLLDRVVINLTSFSGAVDEVMTRGHGWRLLDLGRRLERALQVIELLRHGLVSVPDDERARVELLLDAADSTITYRSRYLTSVQADLAIDLLLIDEANPRSVAFQLERLREHVKRLPEGPNPARRSPEVRSVTDALATVQLAQLEDLAGIENGRRPGLNALLDRLGEDLSGLSEHLTRDYLTHAVSRQISKQ